MKWITGCIVISWLTFSACTRSSPAPVNPPAPLLITQISPLHEPYNSTDTIYGTGFSASLAGNEVFFNGMKATVTGSTITRLLAIVPFGAGTEIYLSA